MTNPESDSRDYLKLLEHEDSLVRSNVVNGIIAELIRPGDADFLIKSLMEYLNHETNPGNIGDARDRIEEIKAARAIQATD